MTPIRTAAKEKRPRRKAQSAATRASQRRSSMLPRCTAKRKGQLHRAATVASAEADTGLRPRLRRGRKKTRLRLEHLRRSLLPRQRTRGRGTVSPPVKKVEEAVNPTSRGGVPPLRPESLSIWSGVETLCVEEWKTVPIDHEVVETMRKRRDFVERAVRNFVRFDGA